MSKRVKISLWKSLLIYNILLTYMIVKVINQIASSEVHILWQSLVEPCWANFRNRQSVCDRHGATMEPNMVSLFFLKIIKYTRRRIYTRIWQGQHITLCRKSIPFISSPEKCCNTIGNVAKQNRMRRPTFIYIDLCNHLQVSFPGFSPTILIVECKNKKMTSAIFNSSVMKIPRAHLLTQVATTFAILIHIYFLVSIVGHDILSPRKRHYRCTFF